MYETVTVDAAISRGRRMITYPVMGIMFGLIALSVFLNAENIIPTSYMAVGIVAGIVLAWVYWSFMITKWKLWAFENVRNVHELRRKAVEAQLIWNEGSFWEKTEIKNSADKDKWASLQNKFNQQDVYTEDFSAPAETTVYYSKGAIAMQIVIMLLCLGFGIYLFIIKSYVGAVLLCAFAVYVIYAEYKKVRNTDAQIILNDKGIQTAAAGFTPWNDIQNDEVITITSGKTSNTYLQYDYPGGFEKVDIAEMDTTKKVLENLLHTYRIRNEKKVIH